MVAVAKDRKRNFRARHPGPRTCLRLETRHRRLGSCLRVCDYSHRRSAESRVGGNPLPYPWKLTVKDINQRLERVLE